MKLGRCFFGLAVAGFLVLASGCSLKPVNFYQLQHQTQPVSSQTDGPAVLLGPVKLADYLQREQIVQRQADGSLLLSREGRWAGDLQEDIGQLLLREMAGRVGSSHIALYPDRVGIEQQVQIVLTISRLDSGVQQPAILEAQWRLLDGQGKVRDTGVVSLAAEHDDGLPGQVQAQARLLQQLAGQLSDKVAGFVRNRSNRLAPGSTGKKQVDDGDSIESRVNRPTITEIAPAPETYRF